MLRRKIFASALSLSVMTTPLASNLVEASEAPEASLNVMENNSIQNFEYDGVTYTVQESSNVRTVDATTSAGTQTFITDKSTGRITVKSDYLSDSQRKDLEDQANSIVLEVESDNSSNNSIEVSTSNSSEVGIQSIVGSWAWSKWDSYTITANGKFTAQVITQTLLSLIPGIGPYAGAFATIMIQYNLKTGYYKRRGATALDSDPNYLWSKIQFNLYKDSARTNLISSKTTSAQKVRVY
ncbi:hypothetical protein KZX50_26100 [Bacillus infantis]|uniref:hypothetical protein n=1 Tax=Bacillus infantis TaxID=324767 RepID=UPI000B9B3B18|nr:hypothetical protein [Bacillus infantis]MCK6208885.1 hypothetical protein [Bacillus infantis]OXT16602.1 hypothetical protein B9K06_14330 [Bacillus sp. OG2]